MKVEENHENKKTFSKAIFEGLIKRKNNQPCFD